MCILGEWGGVNGGSRGFNMESGKHRERVLMLGVRKGGGGGVVDGWGGQEDDMYMCVHAYKVCSCFSPPPSCWS